MDTNTLIAVHELVDESVNALYRYEDKPSVQPIATAQIKLSKALSILQSGLASDSRLDLEG